MIRLTEPGPGVQVLNTPGQRVAGGAGTKQKGLWQALGDGQFAFSYVEV